MRRLLEIDIEGWQGQIKSKRSFPNGYPSPMQVRGRKCAILFPHGACNDTIPGSSHLCEHLIISFFKASLGFTTEDYILLLNVENSLARQALTILRQINIENGQVEVHKVNLIKEIKKVATGSEEELHKELWAGTKYEKSPLGSINTIAQIAPKTIMDIISRLIGGRILVFEDSNGLQELCLPQYLSKGRVGGSKLAIKGARRVQSYLVLDLVGDLEVAYILEKVLSLSNPTKLVQVIEKKDMSILLVENGCVIPQRNEIEELVTKAQSQISAEVQQIKSNFYDSAINELESYYFYGMRWDERIKVMRKAKYHEIVPHLENIDILAHENHSIDYLSMRAGREIMS